MTTYLKLKDGREMVVWSDNTESETMHVYPISDFYTYDPEFQLYEVVRYSDILRTDTNKTIAYMENSK